MRQTNTPALILILLVSVQFVAVQSQIFTNTGALICGNKACDAGQRCNNPLTSECQDVRKQGLLGFALFIGILLLSLIIAVILVPPSKRIGKPYIAPVDTEKFAKNSQEQTSNLFGNQITEKATIEFGSSLGQLNFQYQSSLQKISIGNQANQIKYFASLNSLQRIVISSPDSQNKFVIVDESVSQVVTPKQELMKFYTENRKIFSVFPKGKTPQQSFDPALGAVVFDDTSRTLRYNGKQIARYLEGYVPVEIALGIWILEDPSHEAKKTLEFLDENAFHEQTQKDWVTAYNQHLQSVKQRTQEDQLKKQRELEEQSKKQKEQEDLLKKQKEQQELQQKQELLQKQQKAEEEERKRREIQLEQERLIQEIELEKQSKLDAEKLKLQKELDEKARAEQEKNNLVLKRQNIYKLIDEILKDGKMTEAERKKLHDAEMECPPERCKRKPGKGQYALLCKKCGDAYKKTCIICKRKGLSEINGVIAINCTVHQDQVHTPLPDYCSLCRDQIQDSNRGGFGYYCLNPCSKKDQCASIC